MSGQAMTPRPCCTCCGEPMDTSHASIPAWACRHCGARVPLDLERPTEDALRAELAASKKSVAGLLEEAKERDNRMHGMREQLDAVMQRITEFQAAHSKRLAEIDSLRAELDAIREHMERNSTYWGSGAMPKDTVKAVRDLVDAMESQGKRHGELIRGLRTELIEAEGHIMDCYAHMGITEDAIRSCDASLDAANALARQLRKDIEKEQKRRMGLEAAVEGLLAEARDRTNQLFSMREQLDAAKKRAGELEAEHQRHIDDWLVFQSKFKGHSLGCGYCSLEKKAEEAGHCERGRLKQFTGCGSDSLEDWIAPPTTEDLRARLVGLEADLRLSRTALKGCETSSAAGIDQLRARLGRAVGALKKLFEHPNFEEAFGPYVTSEVKEAVLAAEAGNVLRCRDRAADWMKSAMYQRDATRDGCPRCIHCGFRFEDSHVRDDYQAVCGTDKTLASEAGTPNHSEISKGSKEDL